MRCSKHWPWKLAAAVGLIVVVLAGSPGCGPGTQRAAPTMTMEEACRPVRPKEDRAVARVRQALKKPIDVTFDATPLDEALKVIGEKAGVAVLPDPDLQAAGIDVSRRCVTLALEQVSAGEVLDLLLLSDLGYLVRPDCVLVTTRDAVFRELSVVIYPVADVLPRQDLEGDAGWEELVGVLRRNVNNMSDRSVAAWEDEGGPAAVNFLGGALIVAQTHRGQERVMQFLTMLRQARERGDSSEPVRRAEPAGVKRIRLRLAERTGVAFEKTPLPAAIATVRNALGDVNLVVDPRLDSQGIDLSTRVVTLKQQDAPIGEILRSVLRPDLGYAVRPGCVLVGHQGLAIENLVTVMYPIRHLLVERKLPPDRAQAQAQAEAPGTWSGVERGAFGELFWGQEWEDDFSVGPLEVEDIVIRSISAMTDPNVAAWSEEGGPAEIYCYDGVLVVTQTPEGHERIAELLTLLREGLARVDRQLKE